MLYEVKVYDGNGKLLNIVSPAELNKRTTDYLRSQLTERDKAHIMSLEEDAQTSDLGANYVMA